MRSLLLAAATAAIGLTGALAQNPDGEPTYGSVELEAGFAPDPHSVSITAGGGIDASSLGCVGMIADAPDFDLYYTPGSLPLYLSAEAGADISLIVNLPDGSWVCDDDSAGNLNPGLTFDAPQSGLYDIWIGDLSDTGPSSTLYISELGYGASGTGGGGGSASGIDYSAPPNYGEVSLASGFSDDPYSVGITAGGGNDAATLGGSCVGTISGSPDFNLNYTAGSFPLYLSASSDSDTTLVVNTPDGGWVCDDDGADAPLDPGLVWTKPSSGVYNIWVGHYGGGEYPQATLHVSETGFHTTRLGGGSTGVIDVSAAPAFGSIELTAGFAPDPHTVSLTPGGDIPASTVSSACLGNVASAPDFDLYYTAGSYPLNIYVTSDADTTLLINTPDGQWTCDDDSSLGINPGVSFGKPASGLYDIWVGTYSGGAGGSATLNITEGALPRD